MLKTPLLSHFSFSDPSMMGSSVVRTFVLAAACTFYIVETVTSDSLPVVASCGSESSPLHQLQLDEQSLQGVSLLQLRGLGQRARAASISKHSVHAKARLRKAIKGCATFLECGRDPNTGNFFPCGSKNYANYLVQKNKLRGRQFRGVCIDRYALKVSYELYQLEKRYQRRLRTGACAAAIGEICDLTDQQKRRLGDIYGGRDDDTLEPSGGVDCCEDKDLQCFGSTDSFVTQGTCAYTRYGDFKNRAEGECSDGYNYCEVTDEDPLGGCCERALAVDTLLRCDMTINRCVPVKKERPEETTIGRREEQLSEDVADDEE